MTGKFTHLVVFVKWDNYSIKPVTKKPDDTIIHNGNFFSAQFLFACSNAMKIAVSRQFRMTANMSSVG